MPELPEAENICRALDRSLRGRRIVRVEVFTPAMRTSLLPLESAHLEGVKIVRTRRRGRYVVADLADGRALLMHFGMSGVVRVEGPEVRAQGRDRKELAEHVRAVMSARFRQLNGGA